MNTDETILNILINCWPNQPQFLADFERLGVECSSGGTVWSPSILSSAQQASSTAGDTEKYGESKFDFVFFDLFISLENLREDPGEIF